MLSWKMLPQATPLLALVAKQLRKSEPADWLLEAPAPARATMRAALASSRAAGPRRDRLCPKCIPLLDDLVAAFLGVHLERFEGRTVVFLKAVTRRHTAPGGEDVVSEAQVFRVKVAKAGRAFPCIATT